MNTDELLTCLAELRKVRSLIGIGVRWHCLYLFDVCALIQQATTSTSERWKYIYSPVKVSGQADMDNMV